MTREMKITISKLKTSDAKAVDELMKRHTRTVGFLPLAAIEDHLVRECVLGAKTQNGQLVGYLLYGEYRDRFRITQLCVSEKFRKQGIARCLVETLKASATTQKVIRLSCRNDFPAHKLWSKLGFVPIDEKSGRSKEGHLLTLWRLILATDDQLALFRANSSDEILDVIIDAQIFFDFDEPDSDKTQPSKALLADFFVESLNLWFTDELFSEIGRNQNSEKRSEARKRAGQFLEVRHDPLLVDDFVKELEQILPSANVSQLSDINHLAKAASSEIDTFVTRDQTLLKKASQIDELVNLRVLSPTELIIQLRELSEGDAHTPDRVAGLTLEWRHLTSEEFRSFPLARFLTPGERLGQFRERMEAVLVDNARHQLEVLWSGSEPVALRVLAPEPKGVLNVAFARVASSGDRSLLGRFLISDAIYKAIRNDFEVVAFGTSDFQLNLMQNLTEMGFTKCDDRLVRFCFSHRLDRRGVESRIANLIPEAVDNYRGMEDCELERSCSPVSFNAHQNHFLVTIRPGYALNLFDRQQSSRDLFGGQPDVLLRWTNVYYRSATYHRMLTAPGRVLWYVSGDRKEIVAVSHLDEVVVDTPKELFRRFSKYGTLEWRDLHRMCGGDIEMNLMALQFSHTFPLQTPVPLDEVWSVFDEDGIGRSMQAPRKIPLSTFNRLFQRGYPEQL